MKNKGVKILLIVILSIVSIALINFMIFMIINKDKDLKISLIAFGDNTELIFEKEYEPEQLDRINVDVSSSDVKIEKIDSDKIKVIAYGNKNDEIKEKIEENELFISKENTRTFIFAMFYWSREEIIIQIPNNSDEEFKIHTSSGDISAQDLDINNVQFSTSSGEIECGNIHNGDLKSSSGNILVKNGNEVSLNASSGNIIAGDFNVLAADVSSGNIKVGKIGEGTLKSSSGKIIVESAKNLQSKASSGDIAVNNIENSCELSTTSGNIVVERLSIIQNSSISAKSGNVIINEKNDIYVETQTGSGNADVQSSNRKSDVELKITTTSGNIKVK